MYGGIKTNQVSVDTTAGGTLIAAARPGRGSITIINHSGSVAVYIGDTGLTSSTGAYLAAVAGASITLSTQAAIYGITGSSSATVSYAESY